MLSLIHKELRRLDAETFDVREHEAVCGALPLIRVELDHKWCSVGRRGIFADPAVDAGWRRGAGGATRNSVRRAPRFGLGDVMNRTGA